MIKYAHIKPEKLLDLKYRSVATGLDALVSYETDDDYIVGFHMTHYRFKMRAKELNTILNVQYRLKYVNASFMCFYYPSGAVVETPLFDEP